MTLPIPLAVRLVTSKSDRRVTRDLRSLRFREIAVGGFASCELAFDRPLTVLPEEIGYYGKLYVYAGSVTVWEGRVEDFGRTASDDGVVWELTAMGPSAHAQDRTIPLIYVDKTLSQWTTGGAGSSTNYVQVNPRGDENGDTVIQMQVGNGTTFAAGAAGLSVYSALVDCGQTLGRVAVSWRAGLTSGNFEARLGTSIGTGATNAVETDAVTGATGSLLGQKGAGNVIPASNDTVRLRYARVSTNLGVTTDNCYLEFVNPVIRSQLKDKAGNDIGSGYSTDAVLASEVVADLLGRVLTSYDGANATVATTSYTIDQLAYPDGVTAAKIFDDLMVFEPSFRWGAYESNSAGKYRFEWKAWSTTVRYEADVKDGIYAPGSADDLWNACRVRWRDARGIIRTTRLTSTVPVLAAAGITREYLLDLGDEVGSAAAATQAGQQFLAQHASPPNAGTLTIARPILDLVSGRMAQPYAIKAGELIRVRGILPSVDKLNATTRDGSTVFQIWAKEYDAANAAARLELDTPVKSQAQLTAQASRPVLKRRR